MSQQPNQPDAVKMLEQARQAMILLGQSLLGVMLPAASAAGNAARQLERSLTKEQRDRLRRGPS